MVTLQEVRCAKLFSDFVDQCKILGPALVVQCNLIGFVTFYSVKPHTEK